ncbi:MAG: type II secretion system protein [Clostridia bacterium]|nr:type II secretion system protein [Clostridia bacterium]
MKNPISLKKGFTLVELLVVIAIIAILSTTLGLSINFFVKQAEFKNQAATIETAIKTCNAIYLEVNMGYSGMDVGNKDEYKSRIGNFVEEIYFDEDTVDDNALETDDEKMYIIYKRDTGYTDDPKAEIKCYLYKIVYKVKKNVWKYTYASGKISYKKSGETAFTDYE